jgi:hypothetical protein
MVGTNNKTNLDAFSWTEKKYLELV